MPKEELGIAACDALDHYLNRHKEIKARDMAEKLGISASTISRWRNDPYINVDSEKIELIRKICAETWPDAKQVKRLLEEGWYPSPEEKHINHPYNATITIQHKLNDHSEDGYWGREERRKRATEKKKKLHYKQVALFEKKYNLPELNGKYPRSTRFNRLVDLSKDLSMHLPEIIEKYPQCKEIIFNSSQKYWMDNADQALIELAKIPKEDLKRDEKFDVFTKNDKPQPAGCGTMIIAVTLLLLAII